MLVEPHPINGMEYADLGDGTVRVTDHKSGRWGRFRFDGVWLEGELNHADPHFLMFIGGPKLPPEMDIFYAMAPLPLEAKETPAAAEAPVVAAPEPPEPLLDAPPLVVVPPPPLPPTAPTLDPASVVPLNHASPPFVPLFPDGPPPTVPPAPPAGRRYVTDPPGVSAILVCRA